MASRTNVCTLTDLEDNSLPTLRLRLSNDAEKLGLSRPHHSVANYGVLTDLKRKVENLFQKAKRNANLEEENSEEATKRNEKKIDAIFDEMMNEVDAARGDVKASLKNLTPDQQQDVIEFWALARNFFTKVMNWLQSMFQKVLEKLRQGWKLIKEAVKDIFAIVGEWLEKIF